MLSKSTRVFVNRPGHWSHCLRGEVIEQADIKPERWQIQALKYLDNAQSFKVQETGRLTVKSEYLLEDIPANQEQINALIGEALDA